MFTWFSPVDLPNNRFRYAVIKEESDLVSIAPGDSAEVRRYGIIGGQHDDVLRLLKKLSTAHPDTGQKFCYEAGPRGYPLCRFIRQHGAECLIVAPSKVPRRTGVRPIVPAARLA